MDFPFKRALQYATERMLYESLAQVEIQNIWLFISLRAIRKLALTEEIQVYCKSHFKNLGDDYMDLREGIVFPVPLYGFKHISLITPNMPRVLATMETESLNTETGMLIRNPVLTRRIVPEAYLWWQKNNEAWTIPIGYDFG